MAGPEVLLELLVARAIVGLETVVEDDVAVSAGAIWHVIKRCSLLARNRMMSRLVLKVVEWMTRPAPLVVSKLMQTSVCECYVAIATGTVARVRHVLRMVRPVDCRCVHHG